MSKVCSAYCTHKIDIRSASVQWVQTYLDLFQSFFSRELLFLVHESYVSKCHKLTPNGCTHQVIQAYNKIIWCSYRLTLNTCYQYRLMILWYVEKSVVLSLTFHLQLDQPSLLLKSPVPFSSETSMVLASETAVWDESFQSLLRSRTGKKTIQQWGTFWRHVEAQWRIHEQQSTYPSLTDCSCYFLPFFHVLVNYFLTKWTTESKEHESHTPQNVHTLYVCSCT